MTEYISLLLITLLASYFISSRVMKLILNNLIKTKVTLKDGSVFSGYAIKQKPKTSKEEK